MSECLVESKMKEKQSSWDSFWDRVSFSRWCSTQ